ncbi:hypothetical protein F4802DRAFT_6499 [Xylaria palmicola]|nr:hypothetical protein F4802DRAFT_6499 [Xylaria palmicola]
MRPSSFIALLAVVAYSRPIPQSGVPLIDNLANLVLNTLGELLNGDLLRSLPLVNPTPKPSALTCGFGAKFCVGKCVGECIDGAQAVSNTQQLIPARPIPQRYRVPLGIATIAN